MKQVAIFVISVVTFVILAAFGFVWFFLRTPYPPQPKFGFTGNWRPTNVFGYEERPLPAAVDISQNYSAWQPKTEFGGRYYVARLGGSERQSHFVVSTNSGETPMGAQRYTWVDFDYSDPTNGTYHLSWFMRGEHDPSFLKFDGQYRLHQLEFGRQTNQPPELFIRGIEGIRPEHYVGD